MNWRDILFPADHRFLPLLTQQAEVALRACAALRAVAPPGEMARIEAHGDALRRALSEALARTYATPLDRDDIFGLSSLLDDVVDAAQDALLARAVFGSAGYAHVEEVCLSLQEGAAALGAAVRLLPKTTAQECTRRAKRSENTALSLYRQGVDLALRSRPPEEALRLREVLAALREVARAIGRAADLAADIAVKEK